MSLKKLRQEKFILASQSPRREKLLKVIGLNFTKFNPDIEEKPEKSESPVHYAKRVAKDKAFKAAQTITDSIIISADTIVVHNNKILNKPVDEKEAMKMLKTLSGKTHVVITAVCVLNQQKKKILTEHEETKVTFRKLESAEIVEYVKTGAPLDKAGAYGIQEDFGALFVSSIKGCFYNVVGLPLTRVYKMLNKVV